VSSTLRSRRERGRGARAARMRLSYGLAAALITATFGRPAVAQHAHAGDHSHEQGLHFTHPIIAESVSPDTKLRLDFALQNPGEESEMEFEGEYAFHRAFSIEAGIHFDPEAGAFGETHIITKFANYAFEEQGLLLGYGLELGLPTGGAHAHGGVHEHEEGQHAHADEEPEEDIFEIAPFLNAGVMAGRWELVGWTIFSIPTNQGLQENVGTELRYNASALFHASPRIEALVEAHGQTGLSGRQTDRSVVNLAPGLRIHPLAQRNLALGAALSFPLTEDEAFDTRVLVSAFYHF
jgi:hypothetical protein